MGTASIIAVLNQKGGVGKTTTVINVGSYLAKGGRRVLIVDLDPQGNSTSGLGIDKQELEATLFDVLFDDLPVKEAIQKVGKFEVDILPSNANLAAAEVELAPLAGREQKLKKIIHDLDYDFILIDCPPSLGLLTINALTAANDLLIPVQTEYYALEGLGQLLTTVQQVKKALNPSLNLLGVVLTMYDSRTGLSEQVRQEVAKHFGAKVFETVIPRNVRLAEAPSFGKSIFEHDKWSKGARAYKSLTNELEKRVYG